MSLTPLYLGYDHVTFYVGSVKAMASFLIDKYGFIPYCTMGLETGSRKVSGFVVKNGNVIIQLINTVIPLHTQRTDPLVDVIHTHIAYHGDSVKDVAFKVDNVEGAYEMAIAGGAKSLMEPKTFIDEFGEITMARVSGIADTVHTLVNRSKYNGFLPGPYRMEEYSFNDEVHKDEPISLNCIDHVVQNDGWNKMEEDCKYYEKVFGFHQFWSVDDSVIHTDYSALKSTVMASENEIIKLPINEPAKGLKTSQIEEFMEFNGSAGIQHLALRVDDILTTVDHMKKRGVEFIIVPEQYYSSLKKRLENSKHPRFVEPFERIKELGILVDYDEHGYLLQLFTRPLFDRPSFFLEIIQRRNHDGFGAGNFKSLFEVLELDQARRGNLRDSN
ncbi:hypothetical protein FOA43_003862 [Brettanomyces nanus]|uniref:4-hydroxyphenylpyruvate dioxygenase n=1 Tax=Eeniella nana TaxID=13502 RepID=A0A875S6C5_EENNA|nr:uncharacterized protein FOA43_003862 [Brettanomyces nanus]QPG76473.1 hypothetical protein FOA43_003862 [Brettanomyces nanus]